MSTAPAELLAARALLLEHLDMHPGTPPADLDPAEVGIVGGPAHVWTDTYHCGSDTLARGAWYSAGESPRDRRPDQFAAALDVGDFSRGQANLRHFSAWLVGQCAAGASFTRDIREVIYSLDGRTVRRWDRLGIRSGGDSSHLWHTHISFFRDARGRGAVDMVRAYLIHVGILPAPASTPTNIEEDDMPQFSEGSLAPAKGASRVLVIPPVNAGAVGWGPAYLALGADFGWAKIRVFAYAKGWAQAYPQGEVITLRSGDEAASVQLPQDASKISLRVEDVSPPSPTDGQEVVIGYRLEYGKR